MKNAEAESSGLAQASALLPAASASAICLLSPFAASTADKTISQFQQPPIPHDPTMPHGCSKGKGKMRVKDIRFVAPEHRPALPKH
eukprot:1362060-Rhodomonas_salina.1